MALDAIDHFLLNHAQHEHERWMQKNVFQMGELREQLADQAAANQGHLAIVSQLVDAYNANDWQTIKNILSSYENRTAIYQAAYFPTYNSLKPT